jgi:hypothetical protein
MYQSIQGINNSLVCCIKSPGSCITKFVRIEELICFEIVYNYETESEALDY